MCDGEAGSMSRAEKIAEAQRLRAEGLIYREIGERMGVARSTVGGYFADPDRSKLKARKAVHGQPCVDCGARTSYGAESRHVPEPRCGRCGHEEQKLRKREVRDARRREIERRWLAGESLLQIAAALDTTLNSIAVTLAEMRAEGGYNVPYRRPDIAAYQHAHPEHIAHARAVRRAVAV
jgi:hypothetical protein